MSDYSTSFPKEKSAKKLSLSQSSMLDSVDESDEFNPRKKKNKHDKHKEEVAHTATEMLSPSSNGSVGPEDRRENNPFVKAIGSQRKDFGYVTNLRREVIEIIEPFRDKVLGYDDRFNVLETFAEDLQHRQNKFE
jgi:hypothetical protein